MFDLSDWAWLIVLGVVFLFRALSRLFRSRSATAPPPKPEKMPAPGKPLQAPPEPAPDRFEGGRKGQSEIGPRPIVPK